MGIVWAIIIAIIVLGGGYWLWTSSEDTGTNIPANTTPGGSSAATSTGTTSGSTAPMTATVTYDGNSFSPQSVTVRRGGTVTWVNSSGESMWIASAQHPTHTAYDGTTREDHCPDPAGEAFDQCAGGTGNYSFTFDKTGAWNYHDHLNPTVFGSVRVVE